MITEFGKALRVIRVNNDETAKEMAHKLNIAPSYLSRIERGKKGIPHYFVKRLSDLYNLSEKTIHKLNELAYYDSSKVTIKLSDNTYENKKLALLFADMFNKLPDKQQEEIYNILKEEYDKTCNLSNGNSQKENINE